MTKHMPAGTHFTPEAAMQLIKSQLRDFPGYFQTALRQLAPNTLIHSDPYDISPLLRWIDGRIMLLADAAHACTPNLSQGADQAIKDADTLASCIATDNDTITALEKDRAVPMKPARTLVNIAWKLTATANARNPILVALRSRFMSSIPERIADKKMDFIFDVQF